MNELELFANPYINIIVVIAIVQTIVFAYSMYYVKVKYPYFIKPKMNKDFTPKVNIFVPCKGVDIDMENNLRAIVEQDYPDFIVTFITEDKDDPACNIIKRISKIYPERVKHVIAGYATKCGQKNHNLLAGIREDNDSEVFVFCDGDVQPKSNWLHHLVNPISMNKDIVTTGLPWATPPKPAIPAVLISMIMGYQAKALILFKFLWGGSIAISKETFYRIETYKKWETAIVDDVSLHSLVSKNRLRVIPVVECMSRSYNNVNSIRQVADWFTRQISYMKFYQPHLWVASISQVFNAFFVVATPVLLLISWRYDIWHRESLVTLMFTLYLFVIHNNICLLNDEELPYPVLWRRAIVIADFVAVYSLMRTLFTRKMYWRDIRYDIGWGGVVKKIHRLDTQTVNQKEVTPEELQGKTIELQEAKIN